MQQLQLSILTEENSPEATEILIGLRQYNAGHAGPTIKENLTLAYKNQEGKVVAGLIGHSSWDWFFTSILWVDESCRGQKLGLKLLNEAQNIASARGCKGMHLDTFSFQAPGFYEKLGFTKFGELQDCPIPGMTRFFYKKIF
jgi:ribosomal protein S18 acetylase RimI-like enzyme